MGLWLRKKENCRRLHARVLLPNVDRGDERSGYGEIPASDALSAAAAITQPSAAAITQPSAAGQPTTALAQPTTAAVAAAGITQPTTAAVAVAGVDQLRVLRHQYRMPLWWHGRFRPVWVQHTWVWRARSDAVLLRVQAEQVPFSR